MAHNTRYYGYFVTPAIIISSTGARDRHSTLIGRGFEADDSDWLVRFLSKSSVNWVTPPTFEVVYVFMRASVRARV